MEGQITLFEWKKQNDTTKDRYGKVKKTPKWMRYERCENCQRWAMYSTQDQPPCGWGIFGFCNEHKQRVQGNSYCMNFEERN